MAVPTPVTRVTVTAEFATGFIDEIFQYLEQVIDQLGGEEERGRVRPSAGLSVTRWPGDQVTR